MARPTAYDPEYCARIIASGEAGASIVEMAYDLGVHRETLTNWANANPEFFDAFTQAKAASQVWWERKGRESLTTQGFQGSVWSRSMAARFPEDWRETKGVEHSGGLEVKRPPRDLSDDELAAIAAGQVA